MRSLLSGVVRPHGQEIVSPFLHFTPAAAFGFAFVFVTRRVLRFFARLPPSTALLLLLLSLGGEYAASFSFCATTSSPSLSTSTWSGRTAFFRFREPRRTIVRFVLLVFASTQI